MTGDTGPTIAVAHQSIGDPSYVRDLVADRARVCFGPLTNDAEAAALTDGADAVIVTLQPLPAERIQAFAPSVRVIGRAGVGLDTIDLDAAAARKIAVVHEPTYATTEVANHACALTLAVSRRIVDAGAMVSGGWGLCSDLGPMPDLSTCTLGVIGFGAIGRAYASRMRPFFDCVIAFDPATPHRDILDSGAHPARTLEEVLGTSDVVSLHLPLLPETRGIVGSAQLGAMRRGAILVNVSRGGLVDEVALADALTEGHLSGAGIDVFEKEPLPADSALRAAPNLLMTPHVAWFSDQASNRMAGWTMDDVICLLENRPVTHGRLAVGAEWLTVEAKG